MVASTLTNYPSCDQVFRERRVYASHKGAQTLLPHVCTCTRTRTRTHTSDYTKCLCTRSMHNDLSYCCQILLLMCIMIGTVFEFSILSSKYKTLFGWILIMMVKKCMLWGGFTEGTDDWFWASHQSSDTSVPTNRTWGCLGLSLAMEPPNDLS